MKKRLVLYLMCSVFLVGVLWSVGNTQWDTEIWKRIGTVISPKNSGDSVELPGSLAIGTAVHSSGAGSPEAGVTAPVGSTYTQTDGTGDAILWIKRTGSGFKGWSTVSQVSQQVGPYANYVGKTVYRSDFSSFASYTVSPVGLPAPTADTTNYMTYPNSAKLAPAGGEVVGRYFQKAGLTLDLNGAVHFRWRIYVHPGTGTADPANINDVYILLIDSSGDYRQYNLFNPAITYSATGMSGWLSGVFTVADPSSSGGAGTFDPADVTTIRYGVSAIADTSTAVVSFDPLHFYNTRNTKGLLYLFTDACYTAQWDYAAYLSGLSLAQTNAKTSRPKIMFNINHGYLGTSGKMTLAQAQALKAAGHQFGIYGNTATGTDGNVWLSKAQAEKIRVVANGIDFCKANGLGVPKALGLSGAKGWTAQDEIDFGGYFSIVEGAGDWRTNTVIRGVDPSRIKHSDFVDGSPAAITRTATVDTGTEVLTLNSAVTWVGAHPIRFTVLGGAVSVPQIDTAKIYWATLSDTTHILLYPTATDAVNGTNVLNFTDAGTGMSLTSISSATFGLRVKAFITSKGLWAQGGHIQSAAELAHGNFVLDAFASMVNAGEAQFVSADELITGTGVAGLGD